jgi:NTP pyrophosphatase (non-canonical NTP hydrolase)
MSNASASAATSASPLAPVSLVDVRDALRDFAAARDWDQYHTPRNLLLALTGEVGELAELFQVLYTARVAD